MELAIPVPSVQRKEEHRMGPAPEDTAYAVYSR